MKREARMLLERSLDSLVLSVERFNCPWDRGRQEVMLLLLDRAFELLMKAAILHRGGRIRENGQNETIGHDKCVRVCLTDEKSRCLSNEQALTIQIVNGLRDAAQHYLLEVSEQQLYLYAQAGLTLYADLLKSVFGWAINDHVPERVLPVCTSTPKDMQGLVKAEFDDIKGLVAPKSRKMLQARARIRGLAVIEASLNGERSQPGDDELNGLLLKVRGGAGWRDLFPGIASLEISTNPDDGVPVSIRITKKEGAPVHLVPEGTPGAMIVSVKRVNELDYYSLGLKDLAEKMGLSQPQTLALVRHLSLQTSSEYFKEVEIGKVRFKRYSRKALDALKQSMKTVDMAKVWEMYKPSGKPKSAEGVA
ncbi:MAG: hypothetical protein U0Q55_13380 [Vicinamibacterales bacterium]